MTPEGKVKAKITKLLKSYAPDVWYFMPQAGPFGKAGTPDYIICIGGKFLGVEAKSDTGRATALQTQCMLKIDAAGGRTMIVNGDISLEYLDRYIVTELARIKLDVSS